MSQFKFILFQKKNVIELQTYMISFEKYSFFFFIDVFL